MVQLRLDVLQTDYLRLGIVFVSDGRLVGFWSVQIYYNRFTVNHVSLRMPLITCVARWQTIVFRLCFARVWVAADTYLL